MHDTARVNGNAARPARTKQPRRQDAAKRPAHSGRAPVTLEQQPSVASTDVAPQSAITASAPSETSHSLLPARYVAALKALEKCARIDECKALSDECAALKMYARQAKDPTLRLLTARIHARAVRRCGELLKTIPSSQGRKNLHGELPDGTVTRRKAAQDAGLSERQMITALRIASIPAAQFEALVQSASPPSVTRLAALGRKTGAPRSNAAHPNALSPARTRKLFRSVQEFCLGNEPGDVARAFTSQDSPALREFDPTLRRWLDKFAENLPEADNATAR